MKFNGHWHIYEMEMWDEDYFNEEVQAYIDIDEDGIGEFQFGYVYGEIDGKTCKYANQDRFEFSWAGNDENDQANGSGWLMLKNADTIEGEIRIHMGDNSTFLAKKIIE